jgi:protein phosphatase
MILRVAEHWERTDTGRQRRANEDAYFSRTPLFAVADGMGGARAGEVASRMVVERLQQGLAGGDGSVEERLAAVAAQANGEIHRLATSDHERAGMGTTLTAAYAGDGEVSFAHVGDSRAYRLRGGELSQLTKDHSLVRELVDRGKLTEREAEDHPQRSVITRALGPEAAVNVDSFTVTAQPDDVFLLCTDGLTSMIEQDTIADILRAAPALPEAGQRLIDAANERGGRDNITVVVFRLEAVEGGAPDDQPTQVGADAPSRDEVQRALRGSAPAASAETVAPPRRTAPLPPRPRSREPAPPRRSRMRSLAPGLVALIVLAIIAGGAWVASRAVFFVASNDRGFVTVYRGLPYDGPAGVHLYERFYISGVPAAELPAGRRKAILDHRLRSRTDAADLVRKLELGRVVK